MTQNNDYIFPFQRKHYLDKSGLSIMIIILFFIMDYVKTERISHLIFILKTLHKKYNDTVKMFIRFQLNYMISKTITESIGIILQQ